jgi:hypothetical protein
MKREDFKNKYEKLRYLGDSVYAKFDGYHIILETHNGLPNDPSNHIALEPAVLNALMDYNRAIYEDAENIDKE